MNVTLQRAHDMVRVMGGRCGTAVASLAELQTVRDYWWNGPNEASIAAQSAKAARWLAAHLRTRGIIASGTDVQGKLVSQGRIGQGWVRS